MGTNVAVPIAGAAGGCAGTGCRRSWCPAVGSGEGCEAKRGRFYVRTVVTFVCYARLVVAGVCNVFAAELPAAI